MSARDRKIIARFRYGNEYKSREYWKEEEDTKCRVCKVGEEDLVHILKDCEETRNGERMENILSQDAEGIEVLRRVIRKRKEAEKKEEEEKKRKFYIEVNYVVNLFKN